MSQLQFNSISEAKPGKKWKKLFDTHWRAYRSWYVSKLGSNGPDLATCQSELKRHMPEFYPTYKKLCKLAGNDEVAARFLSGWQPPAYISGCAQAVFKKEPQLVRNYDYDPNLSEGTLLNSAWNGTHIIAVGDCLAGVVDGMNSHGLVASLTFGGRKVVGPGFGVPFILRYVLEFCKTIEQAVAVLKRIPCNMAYNVMVMDKKGDHHMVMLAPDRAATVTDMKVATNHQGAVDWPEHAIFTKTIERELYLYETLSEEGQTAEGVAAEFLQSPLFNRKYSQGFGTVYTSVYRPKEGYMELRWPDKILHQSFAEFEEGILLVHYSEMIPSTVPEHAKAKLDHATRKDLMDLDYWIEYGKSWSSKKQQALIDLLTDSVDPESENKNESYKKVLSEINDVAQGGAKLHWEEIADVWVNIGKKYSKGE